MVDSHNKSTGAYDLYEVKAGTSPNDYLYDIAFQRLVCEATIKVNRAFILHLNKDYRRSGQIELDKLFTATQMDNAINSKRAELASRVDCVRVAGCSMRVHFILALNQKNAPVDIYVIPRCLNIRFMIFHG